jgi:hypothetical protein
MCGSVLKALNFKPYQVTAVQQLKEPDEKKLVIFSSWVLNMVADGYLDPFMFFISDEAWFHFWITLICRIAGIGRQKILKHYFSNTFTTKTSVCGVPSLPHTLSTQYSSRPLSTWTSV